MKVVEPTAEGLEIACEALRAREIVAYPTETVYGLGVDPASSEALARLFGMKRRDAAKPVLLVAGSLEQVERLTGPLDEDAQTYADAFWPGPLSMVLPALASVSSTLLNEEGRVCLRWTESLIARDLCLRFGGSIVSTSANLSGRRPAGSIDELDIEGISVGIDGGRIGAGMPSTVFDPQRKVILRKGAIAAADFEASRLIFNE